MWAHEYAAETAASPEAVWAVLRDVDQWPRWDTSMERVALQGPFAVGTRVAMTPVGQEPIVSTIVAITEPEYYADRTDLGPVTLEFSHTLTRLASGGTRITHRLEITGDGAAELGPQLGPEITADFPEAMDGLLACAAA
jgi:uncharacterized protein YndB with AHSA1/START domain